MNHLTENEIIDFVSFEKLDAASLALASKVNTHIISCERCRKEVSFYQEIYDEFCRLGFKEAFRSSIKKDKACTAEEIMNLVKSNYSEKQRESFIKEYDEIRKIKNETEMQR